MNYEIVNNLDGVSQIGPMAQRLAVATNCTNRFRRDTRFAENSANGIRIEARQLIPEQCRAVQIVRSGIKQSRRIMAYVCRKRLVVAGYGLQPGRGNFDQRCIDTIHTGAGHQTDK